MHIDENYNYDDNFVRMTTIALCKVLTTKVRWINRWSEGKKIRVLIPFYTSFAGQERFMLDAFVDDTVSTRVELNTDQKQRGIVTFKGGSQRDDEFANPNQYLSKETKINDQFRAIVSRTKAVPISLNYEIKIKLDNEWEADTCYSKVLDTLYNYRFFNVSYFGMKIDAFFKLPSDGGIEIPREINLTSDNTITMTFTLEVHTYYPIFEVSTDDLEVCDNDDSIDWDFLGVPKPEIGNSNTFNGDGLIGLQRAYWFNNFIGFKSKNDIMKEKELNRNVEDNNQE